MEIVQFFASNLRRELISDLDDKVVIHHKDLFSDFKYEYDYRELVTGVIKGKTGDAGWSSTALFFLFRTFA